MNARLSFALAFLSSGLCFQDICPACPDGWVKFRESCYLFADEFRSDWTEATHYCASHAGAHLLVIDSAPEELMVRSYAKKLFKHKAPDDSSDSFWFGATDDEIEGLWVWYTNHQPLSGGFTDWAPGQPQNGSPSDQDCGCLWEISDFAMEDCGCSAHFHPLCEKNITGMGEQIIG